MQKPTLVILAAGMGSRYGGLKQIDPVDDDGNLIIDYSVYDAIRAGFTRVVCIIKHAIEKDFQELFGRRMGAHVELRCAFQEMDMLPAGFSLPEGRVKPWGTGHALLCARELVPGPFVAINADDYYGPEAYRAIYQYLTQPRKRGEYAMVGYPVEHTLTDHGEVTRGVCVRDSRGYLKEVVETKGLYRKGSGGAYLQDGAEVELPAGTTISMNFWGFDTGLFDELAEGFPRYLRGALRDDPLKCEYLLPGAVEEMLLAGKASVQVLPTRDSWFGVTYKEDKPIVKAAVQALKEKGVYPQHLWG